MAVALCNNTHHASGDPHRFLDTHQPHFKKVQFFRVILYIRQATRNTAWSFLSPSAGVSFFPLAALFSSFCAAECLRRHQQLIYKTARCPLCFFSLGRFNVHTADAYGKTTQQAASPAPYPTPEVGFRQLAEGRLNPQTHCVATVPVSASTPQSTTSHYNVGSQH